MGERDLRVPLMRRFYGNVSPCESDRLKKKKAFFDRFITGLMHAMRD